MKNFIVDWLKGSTKEKWIIAVLLLLGIILVTILYHTWVKYAGLKEDFSGISKEDLVGVSFNNNETPKFIQMSNPGSTLDVLPMKNGDSYSMTVNLKENSTYKFTEYDTAGSKGIIIDINGKISEKIVEKKKVGKNIWVKREIYFRAPKKLVTITIKATANIMTTDWDLKESILGLDDWPVVDNCVSMAVKYPNKGWLMPFSDASYTDLNGQLVSKSVPIKYFPNQDFTIVFGFTEESMSEQSGMEDLLIVPGNEVNAIRIAMPVREGQLAIQIGTENKILTQTYLTGERHVLTIVKKGNNVTVYKNNFKLGNLDYNKNKSKIHPSRKIQSDLDKIRVNTSRLNCFVIYDNVLDGSDIQKIVGYLVDRLLWPVDKPNNVLPSNISDNTGSDVESNDKSDDGNEMMGPPVRLSSGTYQVVLEKDSYWAKKTHKTGMISLGGNRGKALKIYQLNYPNVRIPKILDPNAPNPTIDACPFIIEDQNPKYAQACRDVDWTKSPMDQDMSKECKIAISHYCKLYNQDDPNCKAWHPDFKDDKHSAKVRKYFEGEPKCSPADFELEQHPDYHLYIRKDRIPCWGCDL